MFGLQDLLLPRQANKWGLPAGLSTLHRLRTMYRVWKDGGVIDTDEPARFGGILTMNIFGRLTCGTGRRALKANRVFFATWDDAVAAGYRPCRNCHPTPDDRYERGADGRWRLVLPIEQSR